MSLRCQDIRCAVDGSHAKIKKCCMKWRSKILSLAPRVSPELKTKGEGLKSGCSGTIKPGMLDLGCKANKCIVAGTGDLGLLPNK